MRFAGPGPRRAAKSFTCVFPPKQDTDAAISPTGNDDTLILDMGEFLFQDFGPAELGLDQHAGNGAIKGINLMQILPGCLSERAGLFPALRSSFQVSHRCTWPNFRQPRQ